MFDFSMLRYFQIFCQVILDRNKDEDEEAGYKEAFRVFSRDDRGCIPAEEMMYYEG